MSNLNIKTIYIITIAYFPFINNENEFFFEIFPILILFYMNIKFKNSVFLNDYKLFFHYVLSYKDLKKMSRINRYIIRNGGCRIVRQWVITTNNKGCTK